MFHMDAYGLSARSYRMPSGMARGVAVAVSHSSVQSVVGCSPLIVYGYIQRFILSCIRGLEYSSYRTRRVAASSRQTKVRQKQDQPLSAAVC